MREKYIILFEIIFIVLAVVLVIFACSYIPDKSNYGTCQSNDITGEPEYIMSSGISTNNYNDAVIDAESYNNGNE